MGWLKAIFGGGQSKDAITAVGDAFDQLFTSDEERLNAAAVMEKLRQQPAVLQTAINQVEAGHRSPFVAGWRPFIGWVCGVGFAYHYVLQPMILFVATLKGVDLPELPEFDMTALQTVLMGMLGLGALRTAEKFGGKSK